MRRICDGFESVDKAAVASSKAALVYGRMTEPSDARLRITHRSR